MDDILDLFHEDLDYEEDIEEVSSPPAKRVRIGCPAEGCDFEPGRSDIQEHWQNVHQQEILLFYCPMRKCKWRARTLERLEEHLRFSRHRLTPAQSSAVIALPPVAVLKKNNGFQDPGDVVAPVPPEILPVGAVDPVMKTTLVARVEEVIREAAWPAPAPMVVPLMSLELEEPPHKQVVVIAEKAAAKPATVSKPPPSPENSQPLMAPSLGDSQSLAAPRPKDFLCPFPLSPGPPHLATALCPEAALSSDTLYPRDDRAAGEFLADASSTVTSPRSSGIVVPGPLPVAPVLDSVSDPVPQVASVAVEKSSDHSPPGTAGVSGFPVREEAAQSFGEDAPPGTPPPAVSGSPGDLRWLPAEGQMDDLEAWLSSIPEELVSVPSPKPAKPVAQLEEAGGLKSGRPVGPLNAEALASRFLRSRLRSLDASVNCLQKVRRDLQESVTEAHKQELQAKEVENGQLRRRIRYLEAQLERAKTGHTTLPTRVGDLQHLSTTRAFVLFPNVGRTAVYNLEPADVSLLELASRSEPLSSDHL